MSNTMHYVLEPSEVIGLKNFAAFLNSTDIFFT